MGTLLFILGIVLFVGLVVLHEFGHAIAARRNGVDVEEFGIGFPPRAWAKKLKDGTIFSLNWLPIGGFVRLKGEHDAAKGKGTYGGASIWVKTKILLAGVIVNWLTAVVIFTILALVGMPQILPNQFSVAGDTVVSTKSVRASNVVKDSPAAKSGVAAGDAIIQLAGEPITGADQFRELTKKHAGETVNFIYEHQNGGKTERTEKSVELNKENQAGKGYIGLGAAEESTQRSTWSAPIVGVGITAQFTYETFAGLGNTVVSLFTAHFAEAGANVTGPVGIVTILNNSAQGGVVPVLFLIGVISLTLAVMNVLPIPALDGGRLFITLIFKALKKPLTKEREESIQAAGMITLLALMLLITVLDVKRFF